MLVLCGRVYTFIGYVSIQTQGLLELNHSEHRGVSEHSVNGYCDSSMMVVLTLEVG